MPYIWILTVATVAEVFKKWLKNFYLSCNFLSNKNILYGNATELLQAAEKNKFRWVIDFLKFNYCNVINVNDIKNKKIAYYILFYFVAKKQTIDVELITKIKRSYYIKLSEDDKNKINLLLKQLKNYCEEELKC